MLAAFGLLEASGLAEGPFQNILAGSDSSASDWSNHPHLIQSRDLREGRRFLPGAAGKAWSWLAAVITGA